MRGGIPVTERFDERGDVTAVVGRQLVDAGDQELSLLIARLPLPGRGLVQRSLEPEIRFDAQQRRGEGKRGGPCSAGGQECRTGRGAATSEHAGRAG